MLKLDSAVSTRVSDALAQGVKDLACENTMTNTKTTRADMLPNLGYVKSGVVELMVKQQQGYSYSTLKRCLHPIVAARVRITIK
jgi:intracellular sulfur oxidation DsrE/DsrF family protein